MKSSNNQTNNPILRTFRIRVEHICTTENASGPPGGASLNTTVFLAPCYTRIGAISWEATHKELQGLRHRTAEISEANIYCYGELPQMLERTEKHVNHIFHLISG